MEEGNIVDIMIYVAYALMGVAVIAAIVMPLVNSLGDPKSLLKGVIGIVFLLIIYGIAYVISQGDVTSVYMKFGVDAAMSKMVGASIISMYILVGLSVLGIVFSEIYKLVS
ncbi:hypothetical protein ACFLU5_03800 [Bacteroidota bacterium]